MANRLGALRAEDALTAAAGSRDSPALLPPL